MRLALYQPDIPPNAGTLLRLGACLGIAIDIIEPCGFPFADRALRRAGLDYLDLAEVHRHRSWAAFLASRGGAGRLVLLTTRGATDYTGFGFEPGDTILVGRESAGAPDEVHAAADARLRIPMAPDARALNVAVAAAMALGEALRQTSSFPSSDMGAATAARAALS